MIPKPTVRTADLKGAAIRIDRLSTRRPEVGGSSICKMISKTLVNFLFVFRNLPKV